MACEAAVVARLLATSAVTDLVGARISPLQIDERTAYPCVVYRLVDKRPTSTFGDDVALSENFVELESVAQTFAGSKALGDAVRGALQRWRGAGGGVTVQATFFDGEVADFDSDLRVYSVRQDFRLWTEER